MKDETNAVKVEVDLTKPLTTLIEKFSSAAGVLYEPTKIKRKAKAEAEAKVILAKASTKAGAIEQRAMERLVREETKRQENIEAVIGNALPQVDENASPENVENDWVVNFFNKSKNVSDQEMRDVWSRLLAGEANNPGSFSKRTVNLLAELDKRDALLFTALAQFSLIVHNGHIMPYVDDVRNELYSKVGINFERLQHLDSLGLINFNNLSGFNIEQHGSKGGSFLLEYRSHKAWIKVPDGRDTKLGVGHVMYTQQGLELLKVCSPQENTELWQYIVAKIKSSGFSVEEVS